MYNFTTNTYQMKRDIINFSEKLCKNSSKPKSKFVTDMIYGISKSKDILLSSIADALDENIKKVNTIERLSKKIGKKEFVNRIIKESKSLKNNVFLWFYQIARGIYNILKMAKNGIRDWEHIRKQKVYDGQLSLL